MDLIIRYPKDMFSISIDFRVENLAVLASLVDLDIDQYLDIYPDPDLCLDPNMNLRP